MIYGSIYAPSEPLSDRVRGQFAGWLPALPMCCSVALGPTKPRSMLSLLDEDCEVAFEVDNLTEHDRRDADAYHTELAQRTKDQARKVDEN